MNNSNNHDIDKDIRINLHMDDKELCSLLVFCFRALEKEPILPVCTLLDMYNQACTEEGMKHITFNKLLNCLLFLNDIQNKNLGLYMDPSPDNPDIISLYILDRNMFENEDDAIVTINDRRFFKLEGPLASKLLEILNNKYQK